jgi:electron transfer flavoprotein beta subunit
VPLNIIVCIKQVPETAEVRIDPETKTLVREGMKAIINPVDANALEAALRLRETYGGKVTVLSMGIPSVQEQLREAVAMGADEAILLSDRALAGSDTWATAYALAAAIRKIGEYDLILTGKQAIDGDTAQVGPGIAERLDIPQITYASAIEMADDRVRVKRMLEEGYEWVEAPPPVLVTVVKQINDPRFPSIKGLMRAKKATITVWSAADVGAEPEKIGLAGSPTRVIRIFTPSRDHHSEMIAGEPAEAAACLVNKLRERKIL